MSNEPARFNRPVSLAEALGADAERAAEQYDERNVAKGLPSLAESTAEILRRRRQGAEIGVFSPTRRYTRTEVFGVPSTEGDGTRPALPPRPGLVQRYDLDPEADLVTEWVSTADITTEQHRQLIAWAESQGAGDSLPARVFLYRFRPGFDPRRYPST